MKHINNLSFVLFIVGLASFLDSCRDKSDPDVDFNDSEGYPLVIYAEIEGAANSRASVTDIDDQWSYTAFQNGDQLGIFSSGGNMSGPTGTGSDPFINQVLTYNEQGGQFSDSEYQSVFSPTHMNGSEVYLYFPYNANTNSTTGLSLRTNTTNAGASLSEPRCIDLLSTSSLTIIGNPQSSGRAALYGSMKHAFSEIIIMRGEGFQSPPEGLDAITVVLSSPFTNLKVTSPEQEGQTWPYTPTLIFSTESGLSEDQAKSWTAWQGGNYGITQENPDGVEAWYIVLPTLQSNFSTVEYIELYDNTGVLRQVTAVKLYNSNGVYTKTLQPSWRYPIEITMEDLVPTVNPFPILPWEGTIDITDARTRGINNLTEFENWVYDYNVYLEDPTDSIKINALMNYGDRTIATDGSSTWHFYLLSDIDLSGYEASTTDDSSGNTASTYVILPVFKDILDGLSTELVNSKFINYQLTGMSKSLIGSLEGNGQIINIDFVDSEISTNTDAAGIVANTMDVTTINNCNIVDGRIINPDGAVGMIAGAVSNVTISNCTVSGVMVGKTYSTANESKYLVGTVSGTNNTFENNSAANVIPSEQ